MIRTIRRTSAALNLIHLHEEFGNHERGSDVVTHSYQWDETNQCFAPPRGVTFEVVEPIQTCHPVCGLGLDVGQGNSLPPGRYESLGLDKSLHWKDEVESFKLYLRNLANGEVVWCMIAFGSACMDLRGVRKLAA